MFSQILQYLKDNAGLILSVVIILAALVIGYRMLMSGLNLLQKNGKLAAPLVTTLRTLSRWLVVLISILLLLQQFGVLPNVWAALMAVLAAIAIGLVAGWSILSNILSTFLVLIYRPFRIGDVVHIPGDNLKGEVVDLNFMYTTLKNEEGQNIRVPNNTFFLKPIISEPGNKSVTLYDQLKSDTPFDA